MITRRRFLVASAAAGLAPALPALTSHPVQAPIINETEKVNSPCLTDFVSTLYYEEGGIDICGTGTINLGVHAARLGNHVVLWPFFTRLLEGEPDLEDVKKIVLLADVVDTVDYIYERFYGYDNDLPQPDLVREDVDSLPDRSSVIIAHERASEYGWAGGDVELTLINSKSYASCASVQLSRDLSRRGV